MKILILTRTLARSGGMVIVSSLIRELVNQGYDITFVAFNPAGEPKIPDNAKDLYEGIETTIYEIPSCQDEDAQIKEYIDAAVKFIRANQAKYDKIILDSWYILIAGIVSQIAGNQNVYHLVQRDPEFEPENHSKIWKAQALQLAGHSKTQRIVVGRTLANTFKDRYGIDYPVLDLYIDDVYRRKSFNVKSRLPIKFIASAANFNQPWKGLDFLIDSLKKFTECEFELTLATNTPIERDFDGVPFTLNITNAQSPTEMCETLMNHDVYLCTSTSESFCLALAEAVTLGMPSIALDSVGNRDYAQGDNYIFVKDKRNFLNQLAKICDTDTRKALHAKSRKSMERYTLDSMVEQFKNALEI